MEIVRLQSVSCYIGVYILSLRGSVVYVGSSMNVFSRLSLHYAKEFDEVKIIWTSKDERLSLEAQKIREYLPSLNGKFMVLRQMDADGQINWQEKKDTTIAKEVGCSREYVRLMRIALDRPVSKNKCKSDYFIQFQEKMAGRKVLDESELETIPHCLKSVLRWCKLLDIELKLTTKTQIYPIQKYPWHLTEWKLPNFLIAEAYRCQATQVSNYRLWLNAPKPQYDGRKTSKDYIRSEMIELVKLEKEKLLKWRNYETNS